MKLDKFTWSVIGIVVVLLVAAVVTVNLPGGESAEAREYRSEDVPETPVYNAFLALERGDVNMARTQYSQTVLDRLENEARGGYDPFGNRSTSAGNRRLRVTRVDVRTDAPDRASVTFVLDTYSQGGLFGAGNTWSREMIVEVVREDGVWKLNSEELFY